MAFTIANWGCQQPSMNAGQETVVPYGGSSTVLNTCNVFTYVSPNDAVATIVAANYFLSMYADLCVGDIIWGSGTDASFAVQVTASTSTSVTVASMGLTTSIGTANIVNGAVTTAKLADLNVTTGKLALNAVGSAQLAANVLQYATVAMTAAQFNGMYAAPFLLLAAPGAGLMNVIDKLDINLVYGSAQFAAGGAVGAQYGNTVHGAGPAASATEAATDYTSATASTMFHISGGLSTGAVTSTAINTAIYLSNATAAFTTGTGGSFVVNIWYKTISAT